VLSRRAGRFFYRTSLPSGVDGEKVEADLTDGILTVRLPKSGIGKRRRITIGGKG
jgi:HSP20 family protein